MLHGLLCVHFNQIHEHHLPISCLMPHCRTAKISLWLSPRVHSAVLSLGMTDVVIENGRVREQQRVALLSQLMMSSLRTGLMLLNSIPILWPHAVCTAVVLQPVTVCCDKNGTKLLSCI